MVLKEQRVDRGADATSWIDRELAACELADARLDARLRTLLEQIGDAVGESVPMACQDWANAKAAYRFFSNDRVNEADILAGHFQATKERFTATQGPILVLHDTTEFSFQRENPEKIGMITITHGRKGKDRRPKPRTVCGILMHSSLVLTTDGLPLGLAAIKFWTRKKFKGTDALKRKINPTRVPIAEKESVRWLENLKQSTATLGDPGRCVHIGDRESDIYELFCTANDVDTYFLFRTCVDRLAGDGSHTVSVEMEEAKVRGRYRVEARDAKGNIELVDLDVKYAKVHVLPPIGKQKEYPPLDLTVIHATERQTPKNRERIEWKLITNLPVQSRQDAIEKMQWYELRWKIEVFHKILKSGCRAEDSKLRTAERLVNLIAVFCIVSWRIFWMTMLNRAAPDASPSLALTPNEIALLDKLVRDKTKPASKSLAHYINKIARLGGYLARAKDLPPGNMVIWRGLQRLAAAMFGAEAIENCG
jgi:Transposase DNA-binding/Transposase Tn5 dimerisation domain